MKGKLVSVLALMLVSVLALATIATAALPARSADSLVDEVKIDGDVIAEGDTNRLDLMRGDDVTVRVKLSSESDHDDVELRAFVGGYEYGDSEDIYERSTVFDMESNVTYTKSLKLTLPDKMDEEDYKVRLVLSDGNGEIQVYNYKLKVDVPRHSLKIKDLVFSPEGSVKAGRALLTTVRVKNTGERDEEGIKVRVSVPSLGVSAADYIDELESDESTTSEELYLRIPTCAQPGTYTVRVVAEFNEGKDQVTRESTVTVTGDESCPVGGESAPKTIISVGSLAQDVARGEGGVVFPLTLNNVGSTSKTYSLSVGGVEAFGSVTVSPASTVVLGAGEAKTLYVYVSANEDASLGDHSFTATISSGSDTLKQLSMSANVVESTAGGWAKVKKGLEVGLVVLVVLLVILGLIIGFNKLKGSEDDEAMDESGQTYY